MSARGTLLLVLLAACAGAQAESGPAAAKPAIDRRIAITIDDLPWASLGEETPPTLAEYHPKLMAALKAGGAPVIGFVNEGKLVASGKVDTARVHLLRDWLDAGAELGNHTQNHADLHAVGLDEYESQILRGETFLRPLLEERGQLPTWFRHPYLRAGRTLADKAALGAFLHEHGYRIAPVTVDNSDWLWAAAYRKAIAAKDAAAQAKLREGYVPYMLDEVGYYERQSIALLGYNLPQILLMHANELNTDCYGELLAGLRARGYGFIDLATALKDPAYKRADAYIGKKGPSWIHRWAIGEQRPQEFFAGEPKVPQWVLDYSGIDAE
ncbi:MAG: polysaccharide deacetylase family protein [Arenimonas sp.]